MGILIAPNFCVCTLGFTPVDERVASLRLRVARCTTVDGGDGALLTSTRDVVSRWEEYFEDLLYRHRLKGSRVRELGEGASHFWG